MMKEYPVIPIDDGFFHCPTRASKIAGLGVTTLFNWTQARCTSYDLPLNVIDYEGRSLIDERDVHTLAAVQKEFPLGKGPIPPDRRQQMRLYAAKIRATLTPSR